MHRARMAAPYLRDFGWEPLILKVDPAEQEGIMDPVLCKTVPESVRTWQAQCLPLSIMRWVGIRNVGLRSFFHLARLGSRIIRDEQPDAVFFSTTMFPLFTLGRYWNLRWGIPCILDYQDPWSIPRQARAMVGAGWKRRMAAVVAGILEPIALRCVSHAVSVSPAYPLALRERYSWLQADFTVLPFGAPEADFEFLKKNPVRQNAFGVNDGKRHWVYVGVVIPGMTTAIRAILQSVRKLLLASPGLRSSLRLHFLGTCYAPAGRSNRIVEPIAKQEGLEDIVDEVTRRLPYFEALQCLLDAEALLVPGSDDPGYTASKVYPYILARKPLLAVFHEGSSVIRVLRETQAGTVIAFRTGEAQDAIGERILAAGWLQGPPRPETNWAAFEPYTARAMTRKMCEVFDGAVEHNRDTISGS